MARQLLVENLGMLWLDAAPSNLAAPTVAELTPGAGIVDLIGVANGEALVTESVTGFSVTPTQVETPDYVALQVGKISGSVSVDDSAMEFYLDDTTNAIFDALAEGDSGYIVIVRGDQTAAAGMSCDVWPSTIQTKDNKFTGANEAAKWVLAVANGVPTKDGTVAA